MEAPPVRNLDITFFIPCRNEERFICATFDCILQVMSTLPQSYEMIVVDDGSSDHAVERIQGYIRLHPTLPIKLIANPRTLGLGHNYLKTADLARGRYYLCVNGDNDLTPQSLKEFVTYTTSEYDMVIPYLYHMSRRPLFRQLVSLSFTFFMRMISGYQITYFNGPVLHKTDNIIRWRSNTTGFAYSAELIIRGLQDKARHKEIGIHTVYHTESSSAFRLRNFLSVTKSFLRVLTWRSQAPRP